MKISYYNNASHKHEQPVRTLYQNTLYWFTNTYPEFKTEELDRAIKEFGLHEEINVVNREDKVGMPAGVGTFKIITIQETFLSYLWCISYSLLFLYDKWIHEPKIDPNYQLTEDLKLKIENAQNLFDYGISLLDRYHPWDKDNLPNPEFYDGLEDSYIEKANGVYLNAVNFILLHELAHVSLGHVDKDTQNKENETTTSESDILREEYEADQFALEKLLKGSNNLTNDKTVAAGIVTGLCSFLFFSSTMKGGDHPDPDERLKLVLDKLNLAEEDNLWGISCLAFKLWSLKNKVPLEWPPVVDTYRDLFTMTVEILKSKKQT